MDAPDDSDSKFHRASASLLSDISSQLPKLLYTRRHQDGIKSPRLWVRDADTYRLIELVEPFQSWPQLLDPHLSRFVSPMIDAFLVYMKASRKQYHSKPKGEAAAKSPLPRAICRLLYVFCKVRGVKVISRFFNNEARNLEPMLRAFITWEGSSISQEENLSTITQGLIWEERYIMLMWLSHLLLAPFDLKSISSESTPEIAVAELDLPALSPDLPLITNSLLLLSFKYLAVPGKEREAASNLLARLALRPDMQKLGLLKSMAAWAMSHFQDRSEEEAPAVYTSIGILSFVARLLNSGEARDLALFVFPLFETFRSVAQNADTFCSGVRASASSRKLIIKILRTALVLALSLEDRSFASGTLPTMLEDAIDHFLTALADQDTPVRFAASKALSIITLKLDPSMGAEVVEAVLGSLAENLLWENPKTGLLVSSNELAKLESQETRPNLSAVNPLRWQGLMLTLAQLLFRRSPPVYQLPGIMTSLLTGLVFEQRLSTGTSMGVGVRDAANFGIWSLSRKYSTAELSNMEMMEIPQSKAKSIYSCQQLLAVELVLAACLDPSGNIRRGSSAALQELIGRHPDTIIEGIPLVQAVDYQAVARRSRATLEVAENAAKLDNIYWESIIDALIEWRGLGAPDAESRRTAAQAVGNISALYSIKGLQRTLTHLVEQVSTNSSQSVESRHGYFLGLAAIIEAYSNILVSQNHETNEPTLQGLAADISRIWSVFKQFLDPSRKDLQSPTLRPELTAESCSRLISALSKACMIGKLTRSADEVSYALGVLSMCLSRTEDIAIRASSDAASSILTILGQDMKKTLVKTWIKDLLSETQSVGGGGRRGFGHVATLGAIYSQLSQDSGQREEVFDCLIVCLSPERPLDFRVSALHSINLGILLNRELDDTLVEVVEQSLKDYTTDQRGDIGSLLRLEAIDCVSKLVASSSAFSNESALFRRLITPVAGLAAEKLDKVRFQAWICLQAAWSTASELPSRKKTFSHLSEVSSADYFAQILELAAVDWLRHAILQGFVTCAGGGSEGTLRSSRDAMGKRFAILTEEEGHDLAAEFFQGLLLVLEDKIKDDRFAIPTLEVLAFVLSSGLVSLSSIPGSIYRKCFVLVQKVHFKSGSIPRLEGAVKIYSGLLECEDLETEVAAKLEIMLLHPYPKVRAAVAEALYTHFESSTLRETDWSVPPKELKARTQLVKDSIATGA